MMPVIMLMEPVSVNLVGLVQSVTLVSMLLFMVVLVNTLILRTDFCLPASSIDDFNKCSGF